MAVLTVREDGTGDHTSLSAAFSAASNGDTIQIEGTWSAYETLNLVENKGNLTIEAVGDAKYPGHMPATPTHYRAKSTGGHVFELAATGTKVRGIEALLDGAGNSDECVRISIDGGEVWIEDNRLWTNTVTSDQDAIYAGNISLTAHVTQNEIIGFARAGIHVQNFDSGTAVTQTWNLNSNAIWNCGRDTGAEPEAGGLSVRDAASGTVLNINMHNNWLVGNDSNADGHDINRFDFSGTVNWDRNWTVRGTIETGVPSGTNETASAQITDSDSPGAGTWVVVQDITNSPFDLRLKDNANNNAQDLHATATAAGLTIPSTDIAGTSRPQNTNYDVGPYEIAVGGTTVIADRIASVGWLSTLNIDRATPAEWLGSLGDTTWPLSTPALAGTDPTDRPIPQRYADTIASVELGGTVYQAFTFLQDPDRYVVVAIRNDQGTGTWTGWTEYVYGPSGPNNLGDAGGDVHFVTCVGFSPDGFLHLNWGQHNNALNYRRSNVAVNNSWDGTLTSAQSMLGTNESSVTYLRFFNDRSGNLYTMFRDGVAGNGDEYLYKYDTATGWASFDGLTAGKLIDGKSNSQNPYMQLDPVFDSQGRLHVAWAWRDTSDVADNHDLYYARWDPTNGWEQSDGTSQTVPVTEANGEQIVAIATNSGLQTMCGLHVDKDDNPHIAYVKDGGSGNAQIFHVYHNGTSWSGEHQLTSTTHPSYPNSPADGGRYLSAPKVQGYTDGTVGIYFTDEDNDHHIEEWFATSPYSSWSRNQFIYNKDGGNYEVKWDREHLRLRGEMHIAFCPWDNSDPAGGFTNEAVLYEPSLTAVGADGTTVTADRQAFIDWMGHKKIDRATALEFIASINIDHTISFEHTLKLVLTHETTIEMLAGVIGDRNTATENLTIQAADRDAAIDFTVGRQRDLDGLTELLGGIGSDSVAPAEWQGAVLVQADRTGAIEWLRQIQHDGALSAETTRIVVTDRAVPVEFQAGRVVDREAFVDWLAGLGLDRRAVAEWQGAVTLVQADRIVSLDWLGTTIADRVTQIDRLQHQLIGRQAAGEHLLAVIGDAAATSEALAGLASDEALPADWLVRLAFDGDTAVEWDGTSLFVAGNTTTFAMSGRGTVFALPGRGTVFRIKGRTRT